MFHPKKNYGVLLFIILLTLSCSEDNGGDNSGGEAPPLGEGEVVVTGTLAINASEGDIGAASLSDRTVELVDDEGNAVATAQTGASGNYSLAINPGLALADSNASPFNQLLKVKSLFLSEDNETGKAVGVKQSLWIDSKNLEINEEGKPTMNIGTQKASKVGAIVGTIQLETGESPIGIDVYIPGTTQTAKTDANGRFIIGFLPKGKYDLRADKDGFGSIEWINIAVKNKETTHLPPANLKIATGPVVESFSLTSGLTFSLTPTTEFKIIARGASKYRISQLTDFRDTIFRPFDVTKTEEIVTFQISGEDGLKTIYLEVADSDGLSVTTELAIHLDTKVPTLPGFSIRSDDAKDGFTNTKTPKIYMDSCKDVTHVFVTEDATKFPEVADFTLECKDDVGVEITISESEGTKNLYVFAKDVANQFSAAPITPYALVFDQTNPVLTISPDSGKYNDSIKLSITAGENVDIYYTFDLSDPTTASPTVTNELVLIDDASLKTKAIDYAGNVSDVVQKDFQIDRDSPLLGSISVNDTDGIVNTTSVPLILGAEGATKMAFAETKPGLTTAVPVTYATSYSYSLSNTDDGIKTIYAMFLDDAGNKLGDNGEIYVSFSLDTTEPEDEGITLYTPESPTGAFNLPLAWSSSYTASRIVYTVEVHNQTSYNNNYNSALRTMTTSSNKVKVSPPLEDTGTYFWRVKATDVAGNDSSWVSSGENKSFELKILGTDFLPRREYIGQENVDSLFAYELVEIADLNPSDGNSGGFNEVAYSIVKTSHTSNGESCSSCGVVKIYDIPNKNELATIGEFLDYREWYGKKILNCDLTGDDKPELIVSAPNAYFTKNTASTGGQIDRYANVGAVFVYDGTTFEKLATIRPPEFTQEANNIEGYNSMGCTWEGEYCTYGWAHHPMIEDHLHSEQTSRYFGYDMACLDKGAGTANGLIVSEPSYNDAGITKGRLSIWENLNTSNGTMTKTDEIIGDDGSSEGFGNAIAFLKDFHVGNGSCAASAEPTIAVGIPRYSGHQGIVKFYQGTFDTSCGNYTGSMEAGTAQFGAKLFNLGKLVESDSSNDYLGVGSQGEDIGIARIYGNGGIFKSLKLGDNTFYDPQTFQRYKHLGYHISAAGDFNNDNTNNQTDIAISVRGARVNGKQNAGKVLIYDLGGIDNDDDNDDGDSDSAPIKEIIGQVTSGAYLGSKFVALKQNNNIHSQASYYLASAPGYQDSSDATCEFPPCPGTATAGESELGAFFEFAEIKMAPTTPSRIEGQSTNANMGTSLAAIEDLDKDGATDFLIGQKGARCDGKPWGSVSLYSVLDKVITKNICAPTADETIGNHVLELIGSGQTPVNRIFVGSEKNGYHFESAELMKNAQIETGGSGVFGRLGDPSMLGIDENSHFSALVNGEFFAVGTPSKNVDDGGVIVFSYDASGGTTMSDSSINGPTGDKEKFGYSTATLIDFTGTNAKNYDLAIGAPDADTTGDNTGKVYIYDGSDLTVPGLKITISTDDTKIKTALGGSEANSNFGAFVLDLGALGDNPDTGETEETYLLIANSNISKGLSNVVPQYFIVGLYDSGTPGYNVVKAEEGIQGGMLGGYARKLEDINGDGKRELALSYPGGTGTLGNTGHVQILSGAALATTTTSDDLLQKLFNPDAAGIDFGVSIEYGDINADGLKDFVIGASGYDSSSYQNAGAVYYFPMVSVKE